ncbi:MAG: hypothetical protein WCC82_07300 [Nitrososphaeraceae archaeon]|jgi:hypothetical protein
MINDSNDVDDALEQYRRTCSIIFGRTSSSQLRYLQSSIDVQQSLLTSCDSTIAKQISWLEDFPKKKNNNKSMNWLVPILEPFLRSYSAAVEASMAMISISYDIASNQLESYKKIVDITNKSYFS